MNLSQTTIFSDITRQLAALSLDAKSVLIIADSLMNIGDFALCVQAIELLRAANKHAVIRVWQWHKPAGGVGEALARLFVPVEIEHGKSLRAAVRKHELLLFAGGQLVRDTGSVACLAGLLAKVVLAKLRGAKVAAISIGVGPVHRVRRLAWRFLLGKLDYVSLRDLESLRHWREIMGDGRKVQVCEDLAFGLSPSVFPARDETCPRSLVIAPCYCDEEKRGIASHVLDRVIAETSAATSATHLIFAAHDRRIDKDLAACSALAARFARPPYTTEVLASCELSAYAAAYGCASTVITNRLHGIVFALLAGRPVVVLDDGCEKIRAVIERFALPRVPAHDRGADASCVGNAWQHDVLCGLRRADKAL